jgi:hypothetical protein
MYKYYLILILPRTRHCPLLLHSLHPPPFPCCDSDGIFWSFFPFFPWRGREAFPPLLLCLNFECKP